MSINFNGKTGKLKNGITAAQLNDVFKGLQGKSQFQSGSITTKVGGVCSLLKNISLVGHRNKMLRTIRFTHRLSHQHELHL